MTGVGILGLLLLKHGLLAHVVDFGYSASRHTNCRFWYVALLFQCLAEMAGTLYVLSHLHLEVVLVVLLVETIGHVITAVLERGTPLHRLLIRHLICEAGIAVAYAVVVWLLVV